MNTIWQKNISNIVSLTYSNEGAYTAIKSSLYSPSPCSLLKIDTSGNILSEISFEERGQYSRNNFGQWLYYLRKYEIGLMIMRNM